MRLSHLLLLIIFSLAHAEEAQLGASLNFSDQTKLHGEILSVDPAAGTLLLRSPELESETSLRTKELWEIEFNTHTAPQEADHCAIATSKPRHDNRRKDNIRGRLTAIDETSITLDSWYAGPLKLKREMISKLDIFPHSPNFYFGPNSLKGWVTSSGKLEENWELKNHSLISKSRHGIAREVAFPDRAKITFTAAWQSSPYFDIIFLSDDGDSNFPSVAYQLTVNNNFLNITRTDANNARSDVLPHVQHSMRQRAQEEATFEIYIDRQSDGTNGLFIDGNKLGTWTGTDDTKDMGTWLHFVPKNKTALKISAISINQWDGHLPEDSSKKENNPGNKLRSSALEELKGERISLANGDNLVGEINKVEQGTLETKTIYGEINIPVARVRAIDVAGINPNEPEPMLMTHEIRAWFHEGGCIHMQLLSMDQKTIRGRSQVFTEDSFDQNGFGEATFDLSAFSRIEFNIWRRQLDLIRYGRPNGW